MRGSPMVLTRVRGRAHATEHWLCSWFPPLFRLAGYWGVYRDLSWPLARKPRRISTLGIARAYRRNAQQFDRAAYSCVHPTTDNSQASLTAALLGPEMEERPLVNKLFRFHALLFGVPLCAFQRAPADFPTKLRCMTLEE